MPANFRDVSSLGCLCQHSNGRWRVRANVDGRNRYGPYRATEAEAADDMAKARRSGTRTGYITILEELAAACPSIHKSAPVRRRPAQRGAASSSVPQPAASVRSRSRSRRGSAARQDNASVRKRPASVGVADGRGRSGGMWRRSLSGVSSSRGGSHPAQARKRPRVASPGAGEGGGDAASSVDAAILSSVRALGRHPI